MVTTSISKSSWRERSGSDVSSSTAADIQQAEDGRRYQWITAWSWI